MHPLLCLSCMSFYFLSIVAFAAGSAFSGVVLATLATIAAVASRYCSGGGSRSGRLSVDLHYETEFNHHIHEPTHRYYDHTSAEPVRLTRSYNPDVPSLGFQKKAVARR